MPNFVINNVFTKSKEQKKKDLARNSMDVIAKRNTDFTPNPLVQPPSLTSALQPIHDKLSNMREQLSRDAPVLTDLFETLQDPQLQALAKTFEGKRRVAYVEDRFIESAKIASNELNSIEEMQNYLTSLKAEVMQVWVRSFANQFVKEQGNMLKYDVGTIEKHLNEVIRYRERVRAQEAQVSAIEEPRRERGWFFV